RDHDWPSKLGPNTRAFFENLVGAMCQPRRCELGLEIRQHAAWHLMLVMESVVRHWYAAWHARRLGQLFYVSAHAFDCWKIKIDAVSHGTKITHHGLCRRLRRTIGQRRDRGVDNVDAQPYPLVVDQRGDAGEAMTMKLYRSCADYRTQGGNQGAYAIYCQQAAGIFDHQPVDLGTIDKLLCFGCEELIGMHRAFAKDERAACFGSQFLRQDQIW